MILINRSNLYNLYRKFDYLPFLAVALILTMSRLLVYARILDLDQFGIFNLFLVTSTIYIATSCFGLYVDLQRKMPVELANGKIKDAIGRLILTCQGALIVAMLSAIGVFAFSLFDHFDMNVIFLGIIFGVSQKIFMIVITESRCATDTMRYSKHTLMRAVLIVIFAIPVAKYFNSAFAIVVTEILISCIISILLLQRLLIRYGVNIKEALSISRKIAQQIEWHSMFSIFVLMMGLAASLNLDRWIAAQYLSITDFSLYSFAAIIMTIAYQGQAMINAALYPAVAIRFAESSSSAFKMTFLVSICMFTLAILGCLVAVPAISWGVETYYTGYIQSVPLILPLALAASFRISDYWGNFLIIAGAEVLALIVGFLSTIIPLLLWTIYGAVTPIGISYLVLAISASNYFCSVLGVIYLQARTVAP